MGEGGENDPDWLATAFGLYDDLGISWNLWPWIEMQDPATLVITVALRLAEADGVAPVIRSDGTIVATIAADGVTQGAPADLLTAGPHTLRVEGRSARTVIRWLEARPVAASG